MKNTKIKRTNLSSIQKDKIIRNNRTVDLKAKITKKKTLCADEIRQNRVINRKVWNLLETLEYIFIALLVWWFIIFWLAILNKIFLIPEEAYWNEDYTKNNYEEIIKELEYNARQVKIDDLSNFKEEVIQVKVEEIKEPVRWTDEKVINETIKFLHKFEWQKLTAYWDIKRYSICSGTPSFKWEIVTQQECDKRLRNRIQTELLRVNRLADWIDWSKKVALISFFYNTWYKINVLNYAKRWDTASVVYLISQYNMAWWKYMQGLQNRRFAEIKMYKGI